MRVPYKHFEGGLTTTWTELFEDAARFASEVGPDRLICISHSADNRTGVVAVWHWEEDGER